MKKLLHERLKKWSCAPHPMQAAYLDTETNNSASLWKAIADEIERYYIPIPCDQDGKPWEIGDAGTTKEETKVIIRGYLGGTTLVVEDGNGVRYALYANELKRPQPKVFDAEGVESKVGDTVWDRFTGDKYTITDLCEDCAYVKVGDSSGYCGDIMPERLTHKEPDSLEKLRDDMAEFNCDHLETASLEERKMSEYIDRLSALIERGA